MTSLLKDCRAPAGGYRHFLKKSVNIYQRRSFHILEEDSSSPLLWKTTNIEFRS